MTGSGSEAQALGREYLFLNTTWQLWPEFNNSQPGASLCGWALARAHAKAGDAFTVSGYPETNANFDDADGSLQSPVIALRALNNH